VSISNSQRHNSQGDVSRSPSGRFAGLSIVLACSAVALLSTAFLIGSTPDEEEFRFAILSAWLHVRSLAQGQYEFWTPALGLGIPQPFVPNFSLHPLLPLLAALSPVTWVRVLLAVHTVIGASGTWRLGRALQLTPPAIATCVVTYLLATPVQNHVLTDFWPTHFVAWTAAPWILLVTWRLLASDETRLFRTSILLGLAVGLTAANTNPGHAAVYIAIVFAVVIGRARAVARRWMWLGLAALIALAIASPNIAQLATERPFFGGDLGLSNLPEPLPFAAAWDVFLRPSSRFGGARTVFFGGPFAVLCLIGCVRFAATRRDLVIGVIVSALLLFTPILAMSFVSARYHFRDPLTLCAIPLAGLVLDGLLRSRRLRAVGALVIALQVGVVTVSAWPYLKRTWEPEARRAEAWRGATGDTPFVDRLLEMMPAPGRLMYSPRVDLEVSERAFVRDGLGVNALAYRRVDVVNGWFKGVSADSLWPNDRLFYGRIRTPGGLMTSDESLDLLGVRYVLAEAGEVVAPGLRPLGALHTSKGASLALHENPDAWPRAFVVDGLPARLRLTPECGHDRLLCRDLTALEERRASGRIEATRRHGRIDVTVTGLSEPRMLVLSEMFRPGWRVSIDGAAASTEALYGALVAVRLPAGHVASVRFDYRPAAPLAAAALSWIAVIGSVTALVVDTVIARRRSARTSASSGTA
jgi:hypothetical protein